MQTYTYDKTRHPQLFRVVDRDGEWKHYVLKRPERDDLFLRGSTSILNRSYAKGAGLIDWLSNHTKAERDDILRSTGERGDRIHKAIQAMLEMESPSGDVKFTRELGIYSSATQDYTKLANDEWDALLSWQSFWKTHDPILITAERPVYNVTDGYAGTFDALLIITKECGIRTCKCKDRVGKIGLYDWKSGSGIYPSYSAQLASYANGDNMVEYLPEEKNIDYLCVLRLGTRHITTGGYEMVAYDDIPEGMARFRAAKVIDDYEYKPFDPAAEIKDVPDSIDINVKRFIPEVVPVDPPAPEVPKKVGKSKKVLISGK